MAEPLLRSLEFARRMVTYDPDKDGREVRIFDHPFTYETADNARRSYELMVVKVAMFLEEYWAETRVLTWDPMETKGQA